jgi:2-dehydro-3-deoxygluconokinase
MDQPEKQTLHPHGITLRPSSECHWDLLSLGEVMLRFDPGEGRIVGAREFRVWEGGGEYNVARGLRRCFGLRTSVATALVDNPVGRLVEDLILQGGVDTSHVHWSAFDGVGREARNGIYFLERGFGVRPGLGMMDRGHTAISQLTPGTIDWDHGGAERGVDGAGARGNDRGAPTRHDRELRCELSAFAMEVSRGA